MVNDPSNLRHKPRFTSVASFLHTGIKKVNWPPVNYIQKPESTFNLVWEYHAVSKSG